MMSAANRFGDHTGRPFAEGVALQALKVTVYQEARRSRGGGGKSTSMAWGWNLGAA